jgi:hypothetical protein
MHKEEDYSMMTRRAALLLPAALLAPALLTPVQAQVNSSIFICRDSDRGTDTKQYRLGDIVQVIDDPGNFWLSSDTALYTPFWYVRIQGLAAASARQYMATAFNEDESLMFKRPWGVKTSSVPANVRNFLTTNHFVGFGSSGYQTLFGATVPAVMSDFTLPWSTVRTYIFNKITSGTA